MRRLDGDEILFSMAAAWIVVVAVAGALVLRGMWAGLAWMYGAVAV